MKYKNFDIIEYIITLVNEFAVTFGLTEVQAYRYIRNHEGIGFIRSNYGIMHILDLRDGVEGVRNFSRRKGGKI